MSFTPPKIPPLPLTENHLSSIKKSKVMDQLVDAFLLQNFTANQMPIQNMEASSASMSNSSKAFFQSEMNILITMIEQMKRLYAQKENENIGMKKMIEQYEKKLEKQKKLSSKETVNRSKELINTSTQKSQNERKTRKKKQSEQHDVFRAAQSAISQFDRQLLSHSPLNLSLNSNDDAKYLKLKNQLIRTLKAKEQVQEKLRFSNKNYELLNQEYKELKQNQKKSRQELKNLHQQNQKQRIQQSILHNKYRVLEKQYLQLEDKHGKSTAQYQIKIQNLRELLRGIKQHNSPRKMSQKNQQGYYSINRSLNKIQSQQSFVSSNTSNYSLGMSHVQINLKEENQYLRNQLIKALDERGFLKSKIHKLQKTIQKYQKQDQNKNNQKSGNQNNQNFGNSLEEKYSLSHNFKKNKNSSILVVQNTQKKENQMIEEKKTLNYLKEIDYIVFPKKQDLKAKTKKQFQSYSKSQFLQLLLKELRDLIEKKSRFQRQLRQALKQNETLKQQQNLVEKRGRKDLSELKGFLKQITQNASQSESIDSTDKAFKNIQLSKDQSEQVQPSKAMSIERQNQHFRIISQQQNEIKSLKMRLLHFQKTQKNNWQTIISNESQSQLNIAQPQSQQNLLIPISPQQYELISIHEARQRQVSHFQMFKQKLTEFYEHTINQLDEWQVSVLKNKELSPKKLIKQIMYQKQQQRSCSPVQIVKRNIMKVSQEFKSIKQGNFDEQCYPKNHQNEQFFKERNMSKSFIDQEENLERIINKRLSEFEKFSSALIHRFVSQQINQDQNNENLEQSEFITDEENQNLLFNRMNWPKTDRQSVQRRNELQIYQIDAKSQSVNSSQLMRQRQLIIREEVSFYIQKTDRPKHLAESIKSNQSSNSLKLF